MRRAPEGVEERQRRTMEYLMIVAVTTQGKAEAPEVSALPGNVVKNRLQVILTAGCLTAHMFGARYRDHYFE